MKCCSTDVSDAGRRIHDDVLSSCLQLCQKAGGDISGRSKSRDQPLALNMEECEWSSVERTATQTCLRHAPLVRVHLLTHLWALLVPCYDAKDKLAQTIAICGCFL